MTLGDRLMVGKYAIILICQVIGIRVKLNILIFPLKKFPTR